MTGGFGQMGGMGGGIPGVGGPGSMGEPPNMGGAPPQGQPMGDPRLGGLALLAGPGAGPGPQPSMGSPYPQGLGQGPGPQPGAPPRPPPVNPLTAWIPSFPQMLSKVNGVATAIPWWIWLTIGVGVVFLFKSDTWMSKVKRWIGKALR